MRFKPGDVVRLNLKKCSRGYTAETYGDSPFVVLKDMDGQIEIRPIYGHIIDGGGDHPRLNSITRLSSFYEIDEFLTAVKNEGERRLHAESGIKDR